MVMWRARAGALRSCGRAGSRTARSSPLGPPRSEPPASAQRQDDGSEGMQGSWGLVSDYYTLGSVARTEREPASGLRRLT